MNFPYIGSGPYCYANAFAMLFGMRAPSTAVIEFATGSPFGMQLLGGTLPFFDPYGWNPERGFDAALDALGWTSDVTRADDEREAIAAAKQALRDGPVWIGPIEMGHLRHQPGMGGPIGADHYVVLLDIDAEQALMHDPQGYPYATLPVAVFMAAWRAETVDYGRPFTMRTGFVQTRVVAEDDAIRAAIPHGIRWLAMRDAADVPPGTFGNGEAALALASMMEAGPDAALRDHLIHFAVRVGARRAADAATCLARVGRDGSAGIAWRQAKLIGALQYPLVAHDFPAAAAALRQLAPTYAELLAVLEAGH